jgi:hypothetical protein
MPKEIQLTQGQVAIVDDEDFERLNQYKWCAAWSEGVQAYYAQRSVNLGERKIITFKMHREILNASEVDHSNGNTLDNRRLNLRAATRLQNSRNRKRRSDNTSGYKGVSWHSKLQKWRTRIMFPEGKHRSLGLFLDKIEAARVYDRAALKYHGEFARLNFPHEEYINGD